MSIENRTAIVVGGAGGIGSAICHRLAADGFRIVIADREVARAEEVLAELSGDGHDAIGIDITDDPDVKRAFDEIESRSPAAVLVAASGGPLADLTTQPNVATLSASDWERTIALNLTGVFHVIKAFAALRLASPLENTRIVAISSTAGHAPQALTDISYVASKAGLFGLVRQAAYDLASAGILVNAVAPGIVGTPAFLRNVPEPIRVDAAAGTLLQRLADPDEIAAGVAFLASAEASYVTGATLDINGGIFMR